VTTDDLTVAWVVRVTDLPAGWARQHGRVALNCHVRTDVTSLAVGEVEAARIGGTAKHARELWSYAHDVLDGDKVVAVSGRSKAVLTGTFDGPYAYRPDLLPEQPHSRRVVWQDEVVRDDLRRAGIELPKLGAAYAFGRVRQRDQDAPQAPPVQQPPPLRSRTRRPPSPRTRTGTVTGRWADPDIESEPWEPCPVGRCDAHTTHRYLLEVPLLTSAAGGPHVLVVGANPSCPDEQWSSNFLAQLRPLAGHLGAASMGIVNLITRGPRT